MAAKVKAGDCGADRGPGEKPEMAGDRDREPRRALVVTVSDGVAAGVREDVSGDGLARRLKELGFDVDRAVVPDEQVQIEQTLITAAERHALILTTGGTGLTPRDVTPQATRAVLEYEVPGLPERMRSEGGRSTPMAYLSRAVAGVLRRCLIVNLPGSPRGALDSLAALEPILDHALVTLAGPFDHDEGRGGRALRAEPAGRPPRIPRS
jgi:molybdenum cofactor synthesis domain-containing protein